MPSLKEMLAAKAKPATDLVGETTGERIILTPEGPHYAKAVDSDGKFLRWLPKPKGIIARASEPAAVPAKPLPTPVSQEPRQLGQIERGQDVPFEFPSEKSSEGAKTWLFARQQPETQLGIAIEPGETSDHAWIVVQSPTDPGRLLYLYRLPLLTPSSGANPY